jgi:hypothetical protein
MRINSFALKAVFLLACALLIFLWSCTTNEGSGNTNSNVDSPQMYSIEESVNTNIGVGLMQSRIIAFAQYLNGEICSIDTESYGDVKSNIHDLLKASNDSIVKFCVADLSGGDFPNLYINMKSGYTGVVWWANGKLSHGFRIEQGQLLRDDGTMLWHHFGGAYPHQSYTWYGYGTDSTKEVSFIRWDIDEDGDFDTYDEYEFDGNAVTMEQWNELSVKYLEEGTSVLEWIEWEGFDVWYETVMSNAG